jgi:hypothetical protein
MELMYESYKTGKGPIIIQLTNKTGEENQCKFKPYGTHTEMRTTRPSSNYFPTTSGDGLETLCYF